MAGVLYPQAELHYHRFYTMHCTWLRSLGTASYIQHISYRSWLCVNLWFHLGLPNLKAHGLWLWTQPQRVTLYTWDLKHSCSTPCDSAVLASRASVGTKTQDTLQINALLFFSTCSVKLVLLSKREILNMTCTYWYYAGWVVTGYYKDLSKANTNTCSLHLCETVKKGYLKQHLPSRVVVEMDGWMDGCRV